MAEPGLRARVRQPAPIPLDMEIACAPGELLAIVGPSGSGKTTLLRSIAGLYHPREAEIACNGEPWSGLAPHLRPVGLVFQSYALFPHMSARANVEAALWRLPAAERAARAAALLSLVHLDGLGARKPAQLSGGQQQRVALARALAREPKALLLDEPFSAVDRATRGRLYAELSEIRRTLSIPILLVTHDVEEAARLADTLCLIENGAVVQTGAPAEVLAKPVSTQAARLLDLRNVFAPEALPDIGGGRAWHIQPSMVRVSTGSGELSGTVLRRIDLIESAQLQIEIDAPGQPLLTATAPGDVAAGARVFVSLPREAIHVLER